MLIDALTLYRHYISISLRAQLQYRANFFIQTFAHFMMTGLEFLGLAAMFKRFGSFAGWSLPEIGLLYGMIGLAFSLSESIARGFDVFPRLIRMGDFDRVLLRPRSSAFQVLAQELQLMRLGRFTQATIVLFVSAAHLNIHWTAPKILLVLFGITGGICLFSGLFVLQATLCFWTIDSIELINCVTYGGVETGQYPITIYRPWFRALFTVIIPLATINYFPAHALLGRIEPMGTNTLVQSLTPFCGLAFLLISLQFWKIGVRHYRSTGS